MRTIAQEYGISDVGLAKVCRKLMIPLPGRGYWAKKEAGQAVTRLPLPPIKDKVLVRRGSPISMTSALTRSEPRSRGLSGQAASSC